MSLFTRYLSRDADVTYFFTANCTRWVDLSSTIKTTENYSFVANPARHKFYRKRQRKQIVWAVRVLQKQRVNIRSNCAGSARNRMNYSPYNAAARKKKYET